MINMFLSIGFFEAFYELKFLQMAFIAGLIIGILAPVVGTFVVIRRLSFIADTLSHFSLAGIAIGVFAYYQLKIDFIPPMFIGLLFSIIGTFMIEKLRNFYKNYKEISMPIVMSLGIAVSGIFIAKSGGLNANLTNAILFGSINAVSESDLIAIIIIAIIILVLAIKFRREFIAHSFDEKYAKILGINVALIQYLFILVLALVISAFIEVIGVLLVSSLMIIPVASAMRIGKSLKDTLLLSIVFSEVSIFLGFYISYYLVFPPGPTIVMINVLILFSILLIDKIGSKQK